MLQKLNPVARLRGIQLVTILRSARIGLRYCEAELSNKLDQDVKNTINYIRFPFKLRI